MVRNSRLALARVVQDRDSQIQDWIIKLRELWFSEICVKIYEVACKEKCSMSYACILVWEETGCDMHVEWNELVQVELFLEIVKCVDSWKVCFWEYIKKEILSKWTKKLVKITSLKVSDIASWTKNNTPSEVHSKEKPEIDILSFLSKEELEVVKSNIITLVNNNYSLLESIRFIKLSPFFFKNLLKIDSEFKNILIQLIKEKRINKWSKIEIDPKVLWIEEDDALLISDDFSLWDSIFENPEIIESLWSEDLKKRNRFWVFKKSRVSQFCDGNNLYTRDEKEIKKIIIALLKIWVKIDEILLDRIPITSAFLWELLRKDEIFFNKFKKAYIEWKINKDGCTPLQINEIFKISKKQIKVSKTKPSLEKVKKETPKKPKTPRKYEPKIVPDGERKRWRKIPRELFVWPIKPKRKYERKWATSNDIIFNIQEEWKLENVQTIQPEIELNTWAKEEISNKKDLKQKRKYTKRATYWADDSIPKWRKPRNKGFSLANVDTEKPPETKEVTTSLVESVKAWAEWLCDVHDTIYNFFEVEWLLWNNSDIIFPEAAFSFIEEKWWIISCTQIWVIDTSKLKWVVSDILDSTQSFDAKARSLYKYNWDVDYEKKIAIIARLLSGKMTVNEIIELKALLFDYWHEDVYFTKVVQDIINRLKKRKK